MYATWIKHLKKGQIKHSFKDYIIYKIKAPWYFKFAFSLTGRPMFFSDESTVIIMLDRWKLVRRTTLENTSQAASKRRFHYRPSWWFGQWYLSQAQVDKRSWKQSKACRKSRTSIDIFCPNFICGFPIMTTYPCMMITAIKAYVLLRV